MLGHLKKIINGDIPTNEVVDQRPVVSFVVIVYDMPLQAEKTLQSLTPQYQDGVSERDYEVIVVENESARNLNPDFLRTLPAPPDEDGQLPPARRA